MAAQAGYLGRGRVVVDSRVRPWDIACFLPIIEEAGGVLTDLAGVRTGFGPSAIATNKALANAARDPFNG